MPELSLSWKCLLQWFLLPFYKFIFKKDNDNNNKVNYELIVLHKMRCLFHVKFQSQISNTQQPHKSSMLHFIALLYIWKRKRKIALNLVTEARGSTWWYGHKTQLKENQVNTGGKKGIMFFYCKLFICTSNVDSFYCL